MSYRARLASELCVLVSGWLHYPRRAFLGLSIRLGAAVAAAARHQQRRREAKEETEKILRDSADAVRKAPRQAQEHGDGEAPWKHLLFLRAGLARVLRSSARGCRTFPGLDCSSTSLAVSSQGEVVRREEANQLY